MNALAFLFVIGLLSLLEQGMSESAGLSLTEKDMLCICRHFNKKRNDTAEDGKDLFCDKIAFDQRWELMFPGRVELRVGVGSLRALIFKSKTVASNAVFAFRDFQHDGLKYIFDDDEYQGYAMFGQETLVPVLGEDGARWASTFLFNFRFYLGFDYYKHSVAFVNEVIKHSNVELNPIFTGFGHGGSFATLMALRFERSSAITFSAHGVREIAERYTLSPATRRAVNLVLDKEELRGQQSSRLCYFRAPDVYTLLSDKNSVYSDHGFVAVTSQRECEDTF